MAKAYFYRDHAGILHGTERLDFAQEYAEGKIVERNLPVLGGWLMIDGEKVFSYDDGRVFHVSKNVEKGGIALEDCTEELQTKIKGALAEIGL